MSATTEIDQDKTGTGQQDRTNNDFSELKVDDQFLNSDAIRDIRRNHSTEPGALKPTPEMSPRPIYNVSNRGFQEVFQALQKWEGIVTKLEDEVFHARLSPILGDETGEKEVEIYMQEIGEDERSLIQAGAVFYWSIGYLDRSSGRSRTSVIRFRRLPVWNDQELENAKVSENWMSEIFQHR